ncbi:hypothetical protein [Dyella flagellata]|uniref:hypothetical protein n=1 Tax=Dyella flagellata TaxID=1867833 RepID=UPI0024E16F3A|nr:hypothetical protein [Dyella flagellata]
MEDLRSVDKNGSKIACARLPFYCVFRRDPFRFNGVKSFVSPHACIEGFDAMGPLNLIKRRRHTPSLGMGCRTPGIKAMRGRLVVA